MADVWTSYEFAQIQYTIRDLVLERLGKKEGKKFVGSESYIQLWDLGERIYAKNINTPTEVVKRSATMLLAKILNS